MNDVLSVQDTCNSQWNGSGVKPDDGSGTMRYYTIHKVRRAATVVFSGGEIGFPSAQQVGTCRHSVAGNEKKYDDTILGKYQTQVSSCANTGISVRLADWNGNPLPANATIAVKVRQPDGGKCAATLSGSVIGNSTKPTTHTALLEKCTGVGESVDFSVTVTSGGASKTSTFSVDVPAP